MSSWWTRLRLSCFAVKIALLQEGIDRPESQEGEGPGTKQDNTAGPIGRGARSGRVPGGDRRTLPSAGGGVPGPSRFSLPSPGSRKVPELASGDVAGPPPRAISGSAADDGPRLAPAIGRPPRARAGDHDRCGPGDPGGSRRRRVGSPGPRRPSGRRYRRCRRGSSVGPWRPPGRRAGPQGRIAVVAWGWGARGSRGAPGTPAACSRPCAGAVRGSRSPDGPAPARHADSRAAVRSAASPPTAMGAGGRRRTRAPEESAAGRKGLNRPAPSTPATALCGAGTCGRRTGPARRGDRPRTALSDLPRRSPGPGDRPRRCAPRWPDRP